MADLGISFGASCIKFILTFQSLDPTIGKNDSGGRFYSANMRARGAPTNKSGRIILFKLSILYIKRFVGPYAWPSCYSGGLKREVRLRYEKAELKPKKTQSNSRTDPSPSQSVQLLRATAESHHQPQTGNNSPPLLLLP